MLVRLASTRLTLIGMLLLAAGALINYGNPPETSAWVLAVPMLLMAVNLSAAILSNKAIRASTGLLLFHVGLLLLSSLAAYGQLHRLDGQVELVTGQSFDPDDLFALRVGPLHHADWTGVAFEQRGYTVAYSAGLVRGLTHNRVVLPHDGNPETRVVGDDRPLILHGYRFYTTFNKGFAPILLWQPNDPEKPTERGALNMPSYPMFEHRQDQYWTTPVGTQLKLWLQLDTGYTLDDSWLLDARHANGKLVINQEGSRHVLTPGESLRLPGGQLTYESLQTWMGFKVFYDPTLHWLFVAAMLAVAGLGLHFWQRFQHTAKTLDALSGRVQGGQEEHSGNKSSLTPSSLTKSPYPS